jgi:hypothetical protein
MSIASVTESGCTLPTIDNQCLTVDVRSAIGQQEERNLCHLLGLRQSSERDSDGVGTALHTVRIFRDATRRHSAKSMALARPMPDVPPVTSATLSNKPMKHSLNV